MDPISEFITALLAWFEVEENQTAVGVTGAKIVRKGAQSSITAPGCLVHVEPVTATPGGNGSALSITCDVTILCVASSKADYFAALKEATAIACKVIELLGGTTIANSVMQVKEAPPIEIVNPVSNAFITAANFIIEIEMP